MADLYAKYNCTYCQEDITGLRVKCVECPYFDLCLQCFSAGAEIGQHKNDHPYQFMDSGTISVFNGSRGNWTAREHLRLLDAIEQFGFGNWEDISKHIETRTPEEAKEEYIARYLEGNIGKYTWPPSSEDFQPNLIDQTSSDHGPLSPDLTSRLPPLDITTEEAAQLGYMPQRDDFERDYNHEAESLVSSLFLNPAEDDDLDIALKLAHVDMYTNNLRERARRKRVVRDYQLVSNFFSSTRRDTKTGIKKKDTKEEKDFRDRMRVFAQFYTSQEYEQFLANLEKERELRLRLSELHRYRENGVTKHEECVHYEQVMVQIQGPNEADWSEKKSAFVNRLYQFAFHLGQQWAVVHTNTPPHIKKKYCNFREDEKNCSFIGRKFTAKGEMGSMANNNNSSSSNNNNNRTTTLSNLSVEPDSNLNIPTANSGSCSSTVQKLITNGPQKIFTKTTDGSDKSLELESATHLLTQQEKLLCFQLNLKPTQFLTQKTLLLQEYLSTGRKSNIVPQSEPENRILHYLVTNGWIVTT